MGGCYPMECCDSDKEWEQRREMRKFWNDFESFVEKLLDICGVYGTVHSQQILFAIFQKFAAAATPEAMTDLFVDIKTKMEKDAYKMDNEAEQDELQSILNSETTSDTTALSDDD